MTPPSINAPVEEPVPKTEKPKNSRSRDKQRRFNMLKANTQSLWYAKTDAKLKADLDPLAMEERVAKDVAAAVKVVPNPIPISTRGVLIHTQHWLEQAASVRHNIPLTNQQVLATQRVMLGKATRALHASKVPENARELVTVVHLESRMRDELDSVNYLPLPVASVINSIGRVEHYGNVYDPYVPNCPVFNGVLSPRADALTLTNLRQTVLALANPAVPLRTAFFDANLLMLAHVQGGLLLNPNDIMPDVYGPEQLRVDCNIYKTLLNQIQEKIPKMVALHRAEHESNTTALLFTRTHVNGDVIRIQTLDNLIPDAQLSEYIRTHPTLGESNHVHTFCDPVGIGAQIGIVSLLGEILPTFAFMTPLFAIRSSLVSSKRVESSFHARLSLIYS